MKKRYLKTIEDVLALKDTDTKIYEEVGERFNEGSYYKFINGVLCRFDSVKDKWQVNVSIWSEDTPYILEEEPEQEATEEDVGKLCWFWDYTEQKIIGVLSAISTSGYHKICQYRNLYWKHCRRLTQSEVAEITGYKVEEK